MMSLMSKAWGREKTCVTSSLLPCALALSLAQVRDDNIGKMDSTHSDVKLVMFTVAACAFGAAAAVMAFTQG
jgi:hypothetical protein